MKFSNPVPSKNYQPHIDGLRALAIIPVFLYHLNASYCSGGFGGVDVFFVISGYLISLGILKNLDRGTFSLLDFYDKRIRRIIPIYTFTILAVLLIAPFILYPEKLYDLAKMAVSGTFFVANIDLYLSQSYWTQCDMPSPLTNLWSLSVEEQFYVFLPILLMLTYKFARKYVLYILVLVFLASFGMILIHFLQIRFTGDAPFYLLPFRMNELLMGSFLAYFTLKNKENIKESKGTFVSIIALVAFISLIVIYYTLNSTYLFPGLWAIVLCAISVILIKYGNAGITGQMLRSKILVFIGRISYSVYLIHFPLIILCKYMGYDSLSIAEEILITLATLLISTLTWAYIELPIRLSKTWNKKKSYILFAITSSAIVLVASSYFITSGFTKYIAISPYSDIEEIQVVTLGIQDVAPETFVEKYKELDIFRLSSNKKDIPEILLMGDSHAMALSVGIYDEFSKNNIAAISIYKSASSSQYSKHLKGKSLYLDSILEYTKSKPEIKYFIISNRWSLLCNEREEGAKKFISQLKDMGIEVFVVETVPNHLVNIGEYGYKRMLFTPRFEIKSDKKHYEISNSKALEMFEFLEKENIAKIIYVKHLFEDGDFYRIEDENNKLLYRDNHHLSVAGSRFVAPYLVEEFLKRRTDPSSEN